MQKTVYQTDYYGHFAGLTEADESPMEPGVFLMPAGAVEAPPPAEWAEDKWPRWNGSRWELITRPTAANSNDPMDKLREFLQANPDVLAAMNTNQGGV